VLVYEGFFFDPLRADLEAFIRSTQKHVTGRVKVETCGGTCHAVAIDSPNILKREGAAYAQGATWSAEEAEGFIKLYGQSSVLAQRREEPAAPPPAEVLACSS
jgi:argininosuccinate synthase